MKNEIDNEYLFLVLILILTWLFWIPAGFIARADHPIAVAALHYIGGAMPFLVTLFYLALRSSANERAQFLERIIDLKRIKFPFWIVIFITIPFLTMLSAGLSLLVDKGINASLQFSIAPGEWLSVIPMALFLLVFGPLPEEIAWRGYALDKMLKIDSPFRASLVLGFYWIVWHLPLFFIEGSYQYSLGWGSLRFWMFMLDKIPLTFMMTWIFLHSRNSTLSAILFHFIVNYFGELVNMRQSTEIIFISLLWLSAVGIFLFEKKIWLLKPASEKR